MILDQEQFLNIIFNIQRIPQELLIFIGHFRVDHRIITSAPMYDIMFNINYQHIFYFNPG